MWGNDVEETPLFSGQGLDKTAELFGVPLHAIVR